jgi:hypothetical protein
LTLRSRVAEVAWTRRPTSKSGSKIRSPGMTAGRRSNKRWFISLRTVEIASAATVPFLSGFASHPSIGATVGIIGIIITLCAGVTHLCQFQERWIEYRTTAEALKKEKFLFVTKQSPTTPVTTGDAFPILVQRIETVVSKEMSMGAIPHEAGEGEGVAITPYAGGLGHRSAPEGDAKCLPIGCPSCWSAPMTM